MLKKLDELQRKLKPKCHVFIHHEEHYGWCVGVQTDRNEYPYWIRYDAETLKKAIRKLFKFFDGKLEDHSDSKRTAKDFLA